MSFEKWKKKVLSLESFNEIIPIFQKIGIWQKKKDVSVKWCLPSDEIVDGIVHIIIFGIMILKYLTLSF